MKHNKNKKPTCVPTNINYEEHCGVADQSEESFFSLAKIRLCVGFYKYTLKQLEARSDLADFLKKMKMKPLQIEYANLCRAMKDTNTHMHLCLENPDNIQAQADLQDLSKNLAEMCQIIIYRHKLRSLSSPQSLPEQGDQNESTGS